MNSVSKVKIAVGYTLLLAVMFFSLFFVNREMENLMLSDDRDIQWTDSLLTLLREKDTNTIRMLRTLSEANESMVSTSDIEHIIAEQDSAACTAPHHLASRYSGDASQEERVLPSVGGSLCSSQERYGHSGEDLPGICHRHGDCPL